MQSPIHSRGLFVLGVYRERTKERKKERKERKKKAEGKGKGTERRPRLRCLRRRGGHTGPAARPTQTLRAPIFSFLPRAREHVPGTCCTLPAHFPSRFLRPARSVSTTESGLAKGKLRRFLSILLLPGGPPDARRRRASRPPLPPRPSTRTWRTWKCFIASVLGRVKSRGSVDATSRSSPFKRTPLTHMRF